MGNTNIPTNWAMVQGGLIVNIVLALSSDVKTPGFTWVNLSGLIPQPAIGWSYNGGIFTAPVAVISAPVPGTASVVADTMNTAARNALNQNQGSVIFNADTNTLQYFNGTIWVG